MRGWLVALLCLAVSAPAGAGAVEGAVDGAVAPAPEGLESGRLWPIYEGLIKQLRRGGLVLLIRHERTERDSTWDLRAYEEGVCQRQRNLSAVGRAGARALGEALAMLDIRVGPVVSSPYCRNIETAELAFGVLDRVTPALIGPDGDAREAGHVREDLQQLVTAYTRRDSVLVLIGHGGTNLSLSPTFLDEGDALILRPRAQDDPEVIGKMPAARWDEIVRDRQRTEAEARSATPR